MRRTPYVIGTLLAAILLGGAIIGCGAVRPPVRAVAAPIPVTQVALSRGCSAQFRWMPGNGGLCLHTIVLDHLVVQRAVLRGDVAGFYWS